MARIAGVNIPTNKIVQTGLTYIYGIGDKFSKQICSALEISNSKRVNELTDDQILKIREYIAKTKPVLDFYSSRGYFYEIDGNQKIQVITGKIEQILKV